MESKSGGGLHVAIVGAGGTIAPAIVRDLAQSDEVGALTLLDLDGERAALVAEDDGAGKASGATIDARCPAALARALESIDVVVNSASYRLNLEVMRACLASGCHYLDLGGLYWMTLRQLELDDEFKRAGRTAVLGIGSSPGKTNLMAARGARELGSGVEMIEVAAAGRDPEARSDGRLRPPYAIQTLLDELQMQPVVLRDGRAERVAALCDGGEIDFGPPIGRAPTIFTLHSELATFEPSFGCRQASFRLSLAPALLEQLRALAEADQAEVAAAARAAEPQSARTVSVHLVMVQGTDGRRVTVRSLTQPHFGLGGSLVSTAAPAAATVRLLARGSITARGVLAPERCIDPEEMFAELAARGCAIDVI